MTTVYLLRHGIRVSHQEDSLLTEDGITQVALTAERLKELSVRFLYTSPLPRTLQTAQILSQALQLQITEDERLKERLVWGERKGESYEDFIKEWDKTTANRKYKPSIGDSSESAGNRLKGFIDVVLIPQSNTSVIVTHGGLIGDLLQNLFPKENLPMKVDPVTQIPYVEILPCSLTELEIVDNEYRLNRVNDISHLTA